MFTRASFGPLLLCLAVSLGGCAKAPEPAPVATTAVTTNAPPTNSAPARQEFAARGVVKEIKPAEKKIVIRHEAIPNYMQAMTMPFDVMNTNDLAGISTNDQVSFTLVVTPDDGWVEHLKKIGVSTNDPTSQPKERPAVRLVRDVDPLAVGDKMTDYPFTNSLGKKVRLSDFKGQAYAFTFIFTRCPFPNFCPRMSSNFEHVYEELKNNPKAPTNWHLFSISFDPDFDTPERLRDFSATYKPDPKKWDWVTGAMIDIDAIGDQFGLVFEYDKGTFNHNLRTVVVDKNGFIRKIFIGNEWTPEEVAAEIIAGAKGEPVPKENPE